MAQDTSRPRERFATWIAGFVCAATIASTLRYAGFEGWWYKLATVMHHPAASAVSGRRFLFPFLAAQFQRLVPGLSDLDCYFATQIPIIAATVWLAGEWSSRFVPRFGRIFGYVTLTLMLCPTIRYWTFYDTAIVGFWTACLLLLHDRQYAAYLVVFALATLNHENNLLLVPVTVLAFRKTLGPARLALFVGLQLALYAGIRYLTAMFIPATAIVEYGFWDNLFFWRKYSLQTLVFAWSVLVPWWLLAWTGLRTAPPLVRAAAVTLPGLFIVTTLFGRYEESRQFVAFIPTCIALIGCRLTRELSGNQL